MIINLFRKSVVPVYRTVSLISLYIILMGIVGYGVLVFFYLSNTSWIAPFTVNSSDTSVLAIMGQIVSSEAQLTALNLDKTQTEEAAKFNKTQIAALRKLLAKLDSITTDQERVWSQAAIKLQKFDAETNQNIARFSTDVDNGEKLREIVSKDLADGLMTKADAMNALASIDSMAGQTTAAKVAEETLLDDIRQHQMVDFSAVTVDAQRAQLIYQIDSLETAVQVGEAHIREDAALANTIDTAIATAKLSPFYAAINSPKTVQLAVVPYGGSKLFQAGEPVYECVLGLAICHRVGSVSAVYPNEQIFENPLTKTNMRGYLILLSVSDESARSKSLVVGHKPLFF